MNAAEAHRHRTESDANLKLAATDELTGAWTRKFGLEEVSRELERAHRTGAALVLAFIDVDDLKQVNDSHGHLAGDALLKLVGETIRANIRPYDVIVRYGGDEFVCAMPNLSAPSARGRFDKIAAALTAVNAEHSVTVGVAEADPADSLQELDRARRRRPSRSPTQSTERLARSREPMRRDADAAACGGVADQPKTSATVVVLRFAE